MPATAHTHAPAYGTHGHVIPVPGGAAGCGGPGRCPTCASEVVLVGLAAQQEPDFSVCGGAGVCERCRSALLATGVDLDRYRTGGRATLYTLEEARRELSKAECRADGHDWEIVAVRMMGEMEGGPIGLRCDRACGHPGYRIVPARPPGQAADEAGGVHSAAAHATHGWCGQCPGRDTREELQAWRAWMNRLLAEVSG